MIQGIGYSVRQVKQPAHSSNIIYIMMDMDENKLYQKMLASA